MKGDDSDDADDRSTKPIKKAGEELSLCELSRFKSDGLRAQGWCVPCFELASQATNGQQ